MPGSRRRSMSWIAYTGHRFVLGDIRDADLVDSLMEGVDVVVHFAAESHVDRSITGPVGVPRHQRGGHRGSPRCRRPEPHPSLHPRFHRRGVRVGGRRVRPGDCPSRPLFPLLGVEGRQRPDRPLLPGHLRLPGDRHPLHQQLRAVSVPGEGDPALRHQPPRRSQSAGVWHRLQRARLALRRGSLLGPSHARRRRRSRERSTTSGPTPR